MGKKTLAILGLFLSLAALPGVSNAVCAITGVVVRVTAYDDSFSATGGYGRPQIRSATPTL